MRRTEEWLHILAWRSAIKTHLDFSLVRFKSFALIKVHQRFPYFEIAHFPKRVQFMIWLSRSFCILGLIGGKVYIFINIGVVTPRCINRDATRDNHTASSQNHVRSTVWILSPHIDSSSHPLRILALNVGWECKKLKLS